MNRAEIAQQIPEAARLSGDLGVLRPDEQNICGVTVMCKPGHAQDIRSALEVMEGVEIFETSDENIFVVTVEDTPDSWAGNILTQISTIKGVLNAALVYHQIEADA